MTLLVPPIKTQGIKTKLVPVIKESVEWDKEGTWIEPFCGSCVVAFNVQPERAILADTNKHIMAFYQSLQNKTLTPPLVRAFLEEEGTKLARLGEDYYYEVRDRFNQANSPLDFLFLNRACFNGVMRFNREGRFNVPFCRKPQRFDRAYITKIVNQVKQFCEVVQNRDWQFQVADFRQSLEMVGPADFVYVDPPYIGRHVDYYNSWSETDQQELNRLLKTVPSKFLLSTWHSNQYRQNSAIETWAGPQFHLKKQEHFYHVGASEDLRHFMIEALIANYWFPEITTPASSIYQQASFPY